jgi:hypothetical protein
MTKLNAMDTLSRVDDFDRSIATTCSLKHDESVALKSTQRFLKNKRTFFAPCPFAGTLASLTLPASGYI